MIFNFITTEPQGGGSRKRKTLVDLNNFFESEGNVGYANLENFKQLLVQLAKAPALAKHYSNFFQALNQGRYVDGDVEKKTHLINKSDYIHLTLKKGRMVSETTVYLFDNLEKFIRDYADNLISINFGWKELVEFCENH